MPLHGFRSAASLGFKWDPIVATGGTTSTYTVGNITYKVHKFTATGTSTFTITDPGTTGEVEYVVIGGGGGSGGIGDDVQIGGGGGAGGYDSNVKGETAGGGPGGSAIGPRMFLTAGSYSVTVGSGGNAGSGSSRGAGGSGGSSSFNGISVSGGGGGGGGGGAGQSGASGGGGNAGNALGGNRTGGQGNVGGIGGAYGLTGEADVQGGTGAGGGGGAGDRGYPGTSPGEETRIDCDVATTEEVDINNPPAIIDGVVMANGNIILVKDQSDMSQNGIYKYEVGSSSITLKRSSNMDSTAESDPGSYTTVTSGDTYAGTTWSTVPRRTRTVVGTDEIEWETPGRKPPRGGDGGRGIFTSIFTGSPVEYAGGGGGGSGSGTLTSPAGTGYGGGGNGKQSGTGQGTAGAANTGGGAGGSAYYSTTGGTVSGRAGGSGVVAIRYVLSYG